MTRATAIGYTLVIKCGAEESSRSMAIGAIQCCGDVVRMFSACCCTVMAGSTVVHDTGMVEHRVNKGIGIMAYTAILIGRDMRGWFT